MMSRQLAWVACGLLGASLVGCGFEEFDPSQKETSKKIDELTRKVDKLHELVAKQQKKQTKTEESKGQEKRATVEVSDLFGPQPVSIGISGRRSRDDSVFLRGCGRQKIGPGLLAKRGSAKH